MEINEVDDVQEMAVDDGAMVVGEQEFAMDVDEDGDPMDVDEETGVIDTSL